MTKTRHWRIKGFDGTKLIFESDIPRHLLSDKQLNELLKRLDVGISRTMQSSGLTLL